MTLFNDQEINWLAYEQGFGAYKDYVQGGKRTANPYTANSNEWYSWNKGWNAA